MSKKINKILSVTDMSCASCAISVESTLKAQLGVIDASVSYPNKSVVVEYDPKVTNLQTLQKAIEEIGYGLIIDEATTEEDLEEIELSRLKLLKQKLIIAALLSLPVFIISMFLPSNLIPYQNWILMILTIPVLFWSGSKFFINAAKHAQHLTANMDTLVALGTGTAFIFSAFNTLFPNILLDKGFAPHVYFESATVIITLILLGRFLEERSKSKASSAIKKLIGLQPKMLTVLRDNQELSIPIKEVQINDLVLIKPGEKIPVDGIVSTGESYIDESSITGEPLPAHKQINDKVYTGTINQKGSLQIIAQKVGEATLLAQIIQLVREAQSSKPPIQKLVDKIAGIFVPVVMLIAVITFGIWYLIGPAPSMTYAFLTMITVLIIACPCALGLATPTALTVGIGKGAENGILIRNAQSLEVAHKINTIILDKTGTITKGKHEVTDVIWHSEESSTLKNILYTIESKSEHPLASAIKQNFESDQVNSVEMESFKNIPGHGVKAKYDNEWYFVGNQQLLVSNNITISEDALEQHDTLSKNAKTVVFFTDTKAVITVIAVTDSIRTTSVESISELKSMGIDIHMLTGDNKHTAAVIAAKAGITNFQAEVLPTDKGYFVKKLQQQGRIVAMVGDGVNDSHALAQADLGIALSSGSDIAIENAGITLMKSDLKHIVSAIRLSKATTKTIRQNLFWAFIYNIIAIPIAAGILYPFYEILLNPMIAAAAMSMSSVSVVTNSLRLKKVSI